MPDDIHQDHVEEYLCDDVDNSTSLSRERPSRKTGKRIIKVGRKRVINDRLRVENEILKREIRSLRQRLTRLKIRKQRELSENDVVAGASIYLNDDLLSFFKMQINHHKHRVWLESEKQLALGLYYKSPAAYKFLRDTKNFRLPGLTTIRRWVVSMSLFPGINSQFLQQLRIKIESKSNFEREAVLMWDEMKIKPGLQFDPKHDIIEGYQDLGDEFGGREQVMAESVMVFMLGGLTYDWKQPIAYFPTCGVVRGDVIVDIIRGILSALLDIGFNIRHMVCDQSGPNQKAISKLGISEACPFIIINNKKITFAFDAPHVIKSIRNNLIEHDYSIRDQTISWGAIQELRELERSKICKAAPKLTDRHLNPNNFEKMKVSLAVQIFSNSVSSALMAGATCGALRNPNTIATANFCKRVNDIFDCLNARTCFDANPLKRGLSEKNSVVEKRLREDLVWIDKWSKNANKNPDCFKNLKLTIHGTLQLWDELKKEDRPYLLTSRLNQDKLENFFGSMRSRGGYNDNPTVSFFRSTFQYAMMITLLVPPVGTNCEVDETKLLISNFSKDVDESDSTIREESVKKYVNAWFMDETFPESIEEQESDKVDAETDLESLAQNYVAGFLAHSCLNKFACVSCDEILVKRDVVLSSARELLLIWKAYPSTNNASQYGSLKAPTDDFMRIVDAAYIIFEKQFKEIRHLKNVGKCLVELINRYISQKHSNFLEKACPEHLDYIINLFVRTHIHYSVKWITKDYRDAKLKKRTSSNGPRQNKKISKLSY